MSVVILRRRDEQRVGSADRRFERCDRLRVAACFDIGVGERDGRDVIELDLHALRCLFLRRP